VTISITGYRLNESLGDDSWGEAWRALQVSLDRPVYITVFPAEAPIPAIVRVCAALTHPHLRSGIDFGESEGRPFLVTEWVEGPSVGELVQRGGALAEERCLEIGFAAAQALDYASRKGVVHGNLCPETIVIASGGNPKLVGFGADRDRVHSIEDYRSPELKRGRATDVRSDIYSLGAILFYALSGHFPFDDAPPPEVVDGEVVEIPCDLAALNRRLRPDVVSLIERMLSMRPDDRFGNAAELAEAIEAQIGKGDTGGRRAVRPARPGARKSRPVRRRRRRRR
jgi:serine/threonine protein kinase